MRAGVLIPAGLIAVVIACAGCRETTTANDAGPQPPSDDVAVVEDGMEEEKSVARFDGEPGVALEIQQQSGSDVVAAARAIRAELELVREQAPAGVSVIVARDCAKIIEEQVYAVFYDMLLAGALVVAVVLCFLRSSRSTFIAGLAIPASVIASFTFLYLFDLSLNNMTLTVVSQQYIEF